MKKMVWTETRIEGGRFSGLLPEPSHASGNFQDVEMQAARSADASLVPLPSASA
jgi:hypothetical protein